MTQSSSCREKKAEGPQLCSIGTRTVNQKWDSQCPVLLWVLFGDFQVLGFGFGFFFFIIIIVVAVVVLKMKLLLIQWICPMKYISSAPMYTHMYISKLSYMNTSSVPCKKQSWVQTRTTMNSEVHCAYIKGDQTLECDPDFIDTFHWLVF